MRISLLVCLSSFSLILPRSIQAQMVRAMTYNIRYDNPADGPDAWSERKTEVAIFLNEIEYTIIGLQEVLHHQLMFLDSSLTEFDYVGVGRDDGKTKGEYAPIFYRTSELELIDHGHFWLSNTPDVPSVGWDAALPRICTWCRLRLKLLQTEFLVMNTHFDHLGIKARENSALLILEKINELSNQGHLPIVLMGDFNASETETPVKTLMTQLTHDFSEAASKGKEVMSEDEQMKNTDADILPPTFNGFKTDYTDDKMIDHIFTRDCEVLSCMVTDEVRANGRQLSDHFGVVALLHLHIAKRK